MTEQLFIIQYQDRVTGEWIYDKTTNSADAQPRILGLEMEGYEARAILK